MNGTSGQNCTASSASVALSALLASRLVDRMALNGSMEYRLTWKSFCIASQRVICRLRASGHPTSGNDSTGWPTPNTPIDRRSVSIEKMDATGKTADGRKHTASLEHAVKFTGWPSPNAMPTTRGGLQTSAEKAMERKAAGHMMNLDDAAMLAGWTTPQAMEPDAEPRPSRAATGRTTEYLGRQAKSAIGWPTPTVRDHKDGPSKSCENVPDNALLGRVVHLASGTTQCGTSVETENPAGYQLNPFFSAWLQGFLKVWTYCGLLAMDSRLRAKYPDVLRFFEDMETPSTQDSQPSSLKS